MLFDGNEESFFSYLSQALDHDLLDAKKYLSRRKRDILLEVISVDELETGLTNLRVSLNHDDLDELIVARDFSRRLELAVRQTGDEKLIKIYVTIVEDLDWDGSRASYYRYRQEVINIGRSLLGANDTGSARC